MAVGSGVLISRDLILTAAHNLYEKDLRKENASFKFYLGACGTAEKYYEVESWRYPTEFTTCPKNERLEFDYALVKLKQPIDYQEFLELSFPCDTCLMNNNAQTYLSIFGYPKYVQNYKPLNKKGDKIKLLQFGLEKNDRIMVIEPQSYRIGYAISTEGGQSGCPIVVNEKIIAIHNGGGRLTQNFNIGRLMTPDLVFNLRKWCKQLNGSQFAINKQNLCPHLLNKLFEAYIQNSQLKKDKGNIKAKLLEALQTLDQGYKEQLSPKMELQQSLTVLQATSQKQLQEQVHEIEAELHPTREQLLEQAQILCKKGQAEYRKNSLDSALNYFDQCLQIQIQVVGKGGRETAITLCYIGVTHFWHKNYAKAIEYYKQFISIKEKYSQERGSVQYITALSHVGQSYQWIQDFNSGVEYFEQRLLHYQQIQYQDGAIRCAQWLVRNSQLQGGSQRAEELIQKYKI